MICTDCTCASPSLCTRIPHGGVEANRARNNTQSPSSSDTTHTVNKTNPEGKLSKAIKDDQNLPEHSPFLWEKEHFMYPLYEYDKWLVSCVPSPRQLKHARMEFYGFICFNINTFTGEEWGTGKESPALFSPVLPEAR